MSGNESCRIVQLLGACQNPQRRCSVHGDRQEMWPRVRVPECIIAGPLSHRAAPAASADPRQAVANKQPNKQTRANPTTELDETRASNRTCVLSRYPKLSTDTSPPAPTLTHTLPLSLSLCLCEHPMTARVLICSPVGSKSTITGAGGRASA